MKLSVVAYLEALENALCSRDTGTAYGEMTRLLDFNSKVFQLIFAPEDAHRTGLVGITIQEIRGNSEQELAVKCFIHRQDELSTLPMLFFLRPAVFDEKVAELARSLAVEKAGEADEPAAGLPNPGDADQDPDPPAPVAASPENGAAQAEAPFSPVAQDWNPNDPNSFFGPLADDAEQAEEEQG